MKIFKIANVSYLNSFPFRYGLQYLDNCEIEYHVPSQITEKLLNNTIDIGLVPIVTALKNKNLNIISNFCISSESEVKTVLLLSKKPKHQINSICFDKESNTSNQLIKIISKHFWNISPRFTDNDTNCDAKIEIGDKVLLNKNDYPYKYDLASEWKQFSNLPFVFAVWCSNKNIDKDFIVQFNEKLLFGINNIDLALEYYNDKLIISKEDAHHYLKHNISYHLDNYKFESIKKFENLLSIFD